jgi:hypothetical protein
MNLLKNKYIGGFFKARWFPIVPQLGMLTVFVLLIVGGLGVTTDDPDFVYFLRNTNLSNLIVWSGELKVSDTIFRKKDYRPLSFTIFDPFDVPFDFAQG